MIKVPGEINLEGYVLILPSVAVGNVGQLCIDLLIFNLNLNKIGSMWNSMFLPISGLDPYDKNCSSLCTAADFYLATSCKIIFLQLRSPCVGNFTNFFEELVQFIQKRKITKVIILSSSYDYECSDRIDSRTLRYISSDVSLLSNKKLLEDLGWKRHAKQNSVESTDYSYICGGGFASNLCEYLKSMKIVCTVIFGYCSEGNNVYDALWLFNGLNQWLNLLENVNDDIKYPPSWEYFFGKPLSAELY